MKKLGRTLRTLALGVLVLLCTASCGMVMHHVKHGFTKAPPASEFGLGPRSSSAGAFSATVEVQKPLKVGPLQTIHLRLVDAQGAPVQAAQVKVDGGMPQHGHGLPTKPRVTGRTEDGAYVIEGVRFNMGGWWELKFAVENAAVTDSVTFNIRL
jgi:hypothetical protein